MTALPIPAVVSVEDVLAWSEADELHRYELSPEGVLSVVPMPNEEYHSRIATELMVWLIPHFDPPTLIRQNFKVYISVSRGLGVREPDLVVLRERPAQGAVEGLEVLLAVEIASPSTERVDLTDKAQEYAEIGIEHYWTIAGDKTHLVTQRRLNDVGQYIIIDETPLAWILNQDPGELLARPVD